MKEANFNAQRFAELMEKKRFTDGKLAYAANVSRSMIYYMRKGERAKVSAEIIAAVAGPLGTSEQYLMGLTDDPSPIQRTMSTTAAEIVQLVDRLPPSRQRELEGYAKALIDLENQATVESVYEELMECVTRLAELDGGKKALNDLLHYLESMPGKSSGASSPSVPRKRIGGRRASDGVSASEPTQGSE